MDAFNDTAAAHNRTEAEGADVHHSPPDPAEPAECDCNCGDDDQGTYFLDQTSDMVGQVSGDTVTRNSATRSLHDVQQFDEDNPNATPDDWDAFFAQGSGTVLRGTDEWWRKHDEYLETMATVLNLLNKLENADDEMQSYFMSSLEMYVDVARLKQNELGIPDVIGQMLQQRAQIHADNTAMLSQYYQDLALAGVDATSATAPVISDVRDLYEVLSGSDAVSGEELSWFGWGATILGLAIPAFVGGKAIRQALGAGADKVDDVAEAGTEAIEQTGKSADAARCVDGNLGHIPPQYWNRSTNFGGSKVFLRDDLIDPRLVDKDGYTNLERMRQGRAPIGPDGESINLHHVIQDEGGAIAEVTQTFHQQNFRTVHINPSTIPSGIDRNAFNAWRRRYWMNRANDFGGSQ